MDGSRHCAERLVDDPGARGVGDRLRCDKHAHADDDRHCCLDISTLGIDDSEDGAQVPNPGNGP